MTVSESTTDQGCPLAVTGIGLVSAAGSGAGALREAMRARRSHLGRVPRLSALKLALDAGGAVPQEALGSGPISPGEDRILSFCARAAGEALADAGLERKPPSLAGIALGSALGAVEELEALVRAERNGGLSPEAARARRRAAGPPDLTERLAARFALRGPRSTFSVTCASGLCALEQAAADLRLGRAEAMLVGSADTLSGFMQAGFCALRALSPSGRLQPFQPGHDGIVLGEGAAFIVLESEGRARARGVRIYGLIAGNRLISDAAHLTSPDESGAGMARAITLALEDAKMEPQALGAVTVTASGSPIYDRMQSRALHRALGAAAGRVPVTTWEAAIGHALAGTSILGLVHAAQTLAERTVLPVAASGSQPGDLDPECALCYARERETPLDGRAVLALTVGFGGQNGATVVAETPPEGLLRAVRRSKRSEEPPPLPIRSQHAHRRWVGSETCPEGSGEQCGAADRRSSREPASAGGCEARLEAERASARTGRAAERPTGGERASARTGESA